MVDDAPHENKCACLLPKINSLNRSKVINEHNDEGFLVENHPDASVAIE